MMAVEGAQVRAESAVLYNQDSTLTPEPQVSTLGLQCSPTISEPSPFSEKRWSQTGVLSAFPQPNNINLVRVMRRASLDDHHETPHIRQVKLQQIPAAPRAPAMLQVDTDLSLVMSRTYLSELQSGHSIHHQLSALAEAYLQHTGGHSSEGFDSLPSILTPGMLSAGAATQVDIDSELEPELLDAMDDPCAIEGFEPRQGSQHPHAAADEAVWKLGVIPEGSPKGGILVHHGKPAWPVRRVSYTHATHSPSLYGGYPGVMKQRLELRATRRTTALGKRRLTTNVWVMHMLPALFCKSFQRRHPLFHA